MPANKNRGVGGRRGVLLDSFFRNIRQKKKQPAVCAREGAPVINYQKKAELWRQITNSDPAKRASALILRMDTVA